MKSLNSYIAYDETSKKLIQIDSKTYKHKNFLLNVQGSEKSGKTLRTNFDQNILFINNNDEMLVYLHITNGTISEIDYINRGYGSEIVDFQIMAFNKVLILTKDGYLNLWQYKNILVDNNSPPILLDWHRISQTERLDTINPEHRNLRA